jgi:hypothetical protein
MAVLLVSTNRQIGEQFPNQEMHGSLHYKLAHMKQSSATICNNGATQWKFAGLLA